MELRDTKHKAHETCRLYLLVLPGRMALLLEKSAFTKGDPAAFAAFLRRQCPGRVAF